MQWYDKIADPNGYYEVTLAGRGIAFYAIVLTGFVCLALWPPFGRILFRLIAAFSIIGLTYSLLRNAKQSPMYAGPIAIISPDGIRGRGRNAPWAFTWDEIDRFERSRYGILIFKKNSYSMDDCILKTGIGGPKLVRALNKRLALLRADQQPRS